MALRQKEKKGIKPISDPIAEFNSMNKYAWLSNFFQTFFFDPEHKIVFPSVESAYVCFKARKANRLDLLPELAHTLDPKAVKREGSDLWQRETGEDDEEAIAEMKRLVTLKFEQNPAIRAWLVSSEATLREHTSDYFWGTAFGTDLSESSNHLGRIIEEVRQELASGS